MTGNGAARTHTRARPFAVRALSEDELDILEALIHCNRQRAKNGEIIGREVVELEEIGEQREATRQRQLATLKQNAVRTVQETPPARSENGQDKGQTRDAIGAAVGVSRRVAEQAGQVERTARRLEASGQAEEAEQLRTVIEFFVIVEIISMMSGVFKYIYVMTNGGPGFASQVLEFYIAAMGPKIGRDRKGAGCRTAPCDTCP
jgi:hypothetical protein